MTPFQNSLKAAIQTLQALLPSEAKLLTIADVLEQAFLTGRKLLVCGNGGSATDAAHLATEFTCRFKDDRRPYPALALGVDGGLLTAISNDYSFQSVFARQIQAFGQEGDVLMVLSTSGRSRNVLAALEIARSLKMITVALLGRQGGFTQGAAEIELLVPGEDTARIQEAQKFLLHVLCEILEERLPKE